MPDTYHLPALILTVLLLPAFFHLYWRSRDLRPLLWFLGFLFAIAIVAYYCFERPVQRYLRGVLVG